MHVMPGEGPLGFRHRAVAVAVPCVLKILGARVVDGDGWRLRAGPGRGCGCAAAGRFVTLVRGCMSAGLGKIRYL